MGVWDGVNSRSDGMSTIKQLVTNLFRLNNIHIPANRMYLFDQFLQQEQNIATIDVILQQQQVLMAKWKLEDRITNIIQQPIRILNATVGKPYEARFDFDKFNW